MAEIGNRTSVAVSHIGKIKTTMQMIAILLFLLIDVGNPMIIFTLITGLAYIALYIAAVLTLWSMFIYLKAAWPDLKAK